MPSIKPTLFLLLIAVVFGLTYNLLAERGIPITGQWDPETGTVHAGGAASLVTNATEISLEDGYRLWESGETVFIDARSVDFYARGHIPGSINIPVYEFYELEHLIEPYGKDQPYVLYCAGAECLDSHRLRLLLDMEGYSNVSILTAGWPGWSNAGYPSESRVEENHE